MLFMVIERFKGRDPAPIYQRLRESGRQMPEGLKYIDSWIEANFDPVFSGWKQMTHACCSNGCSTGTT